MRRKVRFSIAGLMVAVAIASLAFAILRTEPSTCAGLVFLLTRGVFGVAVVGAICSRSWARAWWLGFALCGLGYLAIVGAHDASGQLRGMPTSKVFDWLWKRFGGGNLPESLMFRRNLAFSPMEVQDAYLNVAHSIWALAIGAVSGALSLVAFGTPELPPMSQSVEARPAVRTLQKERGRRLRIGLAASLVIGAITLIALFVPAGIWAGAAFLLTWGLFGTSALGAMFGVGRLRAVCLGAALFGASYWLLIAGPGVDALPMRLATNRFLEAFRPWFVPTLKGFPASSAEMASTNARILDALEQPVPFQFPEETPLEDVLKYVGTATAGAEGKAIPIYVDPVALQEAEKTLQSPVAIDLVGVPLKTTLRLVLAQLELYYTVREGVVLITSKSSDDEPLIDLYDDPFLLVGHSLLALLSAGIGGAFGALIASRSGRVSDQTAATTTELQKPASEAG